ncbi:MAG TPA: sigma-70 family RNA polymerase sigma factor [Chloroflexota bacterium]|nr:sigma-70 family RNA polymerase sigma factor [Chloroflexota bacterium]
MVSAASVWVKSHRHELSFDELFTRHYASVVTIAYRVLGDAHEAEDVAQDVFCAFYRRHSPDAEYAAPWLHRAAAHTALNVVRGRRRRQQRERLEAAATERLDSSSGASLDPALQAETAESRKEVRAILRRLPRKSASVLALRYSGLSYAEVAAALEVSIGQVGTLLRRAEEAFRKEIIRETSA